MIRADCTEALITMLPDATSPSNCLPTFVPENGASPKHGEPANVTDPLTDISCCRNCACSEPWTPVELCQVPAQTPVRLIIGVGVDVRVGSRVGAVVAVRVGERVVVGTRVSVAVGAGVGVSVSATVPVEVPGAVRVAVAVYTIRVGMDVGGCPPQPYSALLSALIRQSTVTCPSPLQL